MFFFYFTSEKFTYTEIHVFRPMKNFLTNTLTIIWNDRRFRMVIYEGNDWMEWMDIFLLTKANVKSSVYNNFKECEYYKVLTCDFRRKFYIVVCLSTSPYGLSTPPYCLSTSTVWSFYHTVLSFYHTVWSFYPTVLFFYHNVWVDILYFVILFVRDLPTPPL